MVAYSFQSRFVAPIAEGRKRQTIRAERKRHAQVGEVMQLYFGMRTRACRLIGRAMCSQVTPIRLNLAADLIDAGGMLHAWDELDAFAVNDGFTDWADLKAFWAHAHPSTPIFSGIMLRWAHFAP
jgi:hypothetical protein